MGDIALRGQGRAMMASGGKTPAWQRKEGKNPSGGLNRKGIAKRKKAADGGYIGPAINSVYDGVTLNNPSYSKYYKGMI
jgi:hypothetical protein